MNGMRDELCTALGLLGVPGARSQCGGGGISKHELGRKWRAVPWAAVLDGQGEAPYYFMRSGLIRKDLLPCYAEGRVPFTVVVRSHDELVEALAQHAGRVGGTGGGGGRSVGDRGWERESKEERAGPEGTAAVAKKALGSRSTPYY